MKQTFIVLLYMSNAWWWFNWAEISSLLILFWGLRDLRASLKASHVISPFPQLFWQTRSEIWVTIKDLLSSPFLLNSHPQITQTWSSKFLKFHYNSIVLPNYYKQSIIFLKFTLWKTSFKSLVPTEIQERSLSSYIWILRTCIDKHNSLPCSIKPYGFLPKNL